MITRFKIVYATSMVEPYFSKRYKSRKCAQNAADKLNARYAKNGHGDKVHFTVYSLEEYAAAVEGKGEFKLNPFTGQTVWVALGTPACCDPTTETYMSM